jgi:hypothetical protein
MKPMANTGQGRVSVGAVLIVIGLMLLASQFIKGFADRAWPVVIGGAFVAGYFYRKAYGLLIPGCILLGIGAGNLATGSIRNFGDFDSIALGLGFIAIFVIAALYEGRTHWWPLIPGGILVIQGLQAGSQAVRDLVAVGWPVILILVGLILLAGAFRATGRRRV